MAKNENRKKFLKNAGILGLAGLFGFMKMGNTPVVKAGVSDSVTSKDISEDIIYTDGITTANDAFQSGQKAKELAAAVNELKASFSKALADISLTPIFKVLTGRGVGENGTTVNISKFEDVTKALTDYTSEEAGIVDLHPNAATQSPSSYTNVKFDKFHDQVKIASHGTKSITSNGTTSVLGYDSVKVNVSARLKEIGTYNSDVKIFTDVYIPSSMIIAVVNSSGTVNGHIGYLGVNWANCDANFIAPSVTNGSGNELIIKVAKIKAQMSSNGSEGLNQSPSANLSTTLYQLV